MRAAAKNILPLSVCVSILAIVTTDSMGQIHEFQVTLDSPASVITMTGTASADETGNQEITLVPQQDGATLGNASPWTGTLNGIVDLGSRIQITSALMIPEYTGDYCPGNGVVDNVDAGIDPSEHPHPADADYAAADECPHAEPAQYGVTGGADVGGEGGAAFGAIRNGVISFQGVSGLTGVGSDQTNTENWHGFVLHADGDIDGTGVLDDLLPPLRAQFNEPELPIHNERDPAQAVPPSFIGSFAVAGSDVSLTLPLNVPVLIPVSDRDDNGDGIPDEFIKLLFEGDLNADGSLGTMLTPGDANRDGEVNGLDVNIFSANYFRGEPHDHEPNQLEPIDGTHPQFALWDHGDVNLDGKTTDPDLVIISNNFAPGGAGSGAAAVPEPSSLALLLAALAGSCLVRRRSHPTDSRQRRIGEESPHGFGTTTD